MKLSFMTLGCPNWTLEQVIAKAVEYGFDAVDFRGLGDTIDVTTLPAFTTGVAATRKQFNDAGIAVSGISSSISLCDPSKRQTNLDEAKRTIDVAQALSAPNVRVFGNGDPKLGKPELTKIGADCMRAILDLPNAKKLTWLFETHDEWVRGADAKLLLDAIPDAAFGALWDMGHTSRVGGEKPAETFSYIGPRVRYAHVKDAIYDKSHPQATGDGWRFVIPGQGQLPLAESIEILKKAGYTGYLLFEHEKRWHPELEEPEVIFPAFVKWVRALLA